MWFVSPIVYQRRRLLHGYAINFYFYHNKRYKSTPTADVGGSQAIIDGKIKLKNGSEIKEFFEGGLRFEDGSELLADVVIFCTG